MRLARTQQQGSDSLLAREGLAGHPQQREEDCLSRQEPRVVAGKEWQCLKLEFSPVDATACETETSYALGLYKRGPLRR